ncbi:SDR family NAD(P)-dependent oxidoreductase [Ferrovibrio sp.]|uniref:SDR family NAD(P)-dependent oxidoreductase n=1 Tax=Ferrovibrio sp. TaxID=1917215 RepID=UPI003D26C858
MTENIQRALVTGAASGIGASLAGLLAQRGIHVLMADKNPDVIEAAKRLPNAVGHVVDLGIEAEVLELAEFAKSNFGGCDILVNNAGIAPKKDGRGYTVPETDTALWNHVMAVNLTAPFVLCRELVPGMQKSKWGRVVNVASRAGRTRIPGVAAFYSASKAGLIGFTRQLAGEYVADNITVNAVAPGPVQTTLALQSSDATKKKLLETVPIGRHASAEEIASVIDFLCTAAASYVTGACVDVNGGGFMA